MFAAIEGNLIYLIAAAAYGVFAWWNDRRQKKAAAEEEARQASQPKDPSSSQTAQPAAGAESEQERMRKFLEALGVPSGPQSPPLRPTPTAAPAPPKPAPQKPASPTLAPRPVAMPIPPPMMRPRPTAAPVHVPKPRPPVVVEEPLPAESREPGYLQPAAAVAGQVSTDFSRAHQEQMSSAELPSIMAAAMGNAPTTGVSARFVSAQGQALRELLRSKESLRAAIVVSEVLGPPKGI
jgi:hypothetical protein